MRKPEKSEYDPYYEKYIGLIGDNELMLVLEHQPDELRGLTAELSEEKGTFAYAEGKWTIKEVLSHLIDGERLFEYRAFRIARGDRTPIEGFEQDDYTENSHANDRSFAELMEEFSLIRRANMLFFRNLKEEDWLRAGIANDLEISVRALVYTMAGHVRHHTAILRERYLI